jgi:hypothetical protein
MDIMLTEDFIKLAKKYDSIKQETRLLMEDAGNKLKKSLEEGVGIDWVNKVGAGLGAAAKNWKHPIQGYKSGAAGRVAYDSAKNVLSAIEKSNNQAREDIDTLNQTLEKRKNDLKALGSKIEHGLEKSDPEGGKRIKEIIDNDNKEIDKSANQNWAAQIEKMPHKVATVNAN